MSRREPFRARRGALERMQARQDAYEERRRARLERDTYAKNRGTAKESQRDLNRLVDPAREGRALGDPPAKRAIPAATYIATPEDAQQAGFTSPITVVRRYYKAVTVTSTDGACEIDTEQDVRLECTDGAGREVVILIPDGVASEEVP